MKDPGIQRLELSIFSQRGHNNQNRFRGVGSPIVGITLRSSLTVDSGFNIIAENGGCWPCSCLSRLT